MNAAANALASLGLIYLHIPPLQCYDESKCYTRPISKLPTSLLYPIEREKGESDRGR